MKYVLGLAAVGCSTFVEAGSFKWNANDIERRWTPAYPTVGVMPMLGAAPAPTSPPILAEARDFKRSTENNTCAYLSGDADIPLYCQTDSVCVYNPIDTNIGCCPDTSTQCIPYTTCYDMTDASLYTTDNGKTMLCADAHYPRCKRHIFQDDAYTGYTMWGCAIAGGTDKVWYSATYTPSTGGSSASDLDISLTGASATLSSGPTSGSASATSDGSPDTSAMATKSKGSSTNTGAIVGGVIGGVAVVALFVLALVFLLRRRRRGAGPNDGPDAQQAPAGQAGGYPPQSPSSQPAMQQQYEQPNFQPPVDPATGYAAVAPAKPGYSYNATHSMYGSTTVGTPPGSPPSQSPGPVSMISGYPVSNASTYALNPHGDPAYGALQNQGVGAGAVQAHAGNVYHEMPTEPSDRELRELP